VQQQLRQLAQLLAAALRAVLPHRARQAGRLHQCPGRRRALQQPQDGGRQVLQRAAAHKLQQQPVQRLRRRRRRQGMGCDRVGQAAAAQR
jgi:hypothetical protein